MFNCTIYVICDNTGIKLINALKKKVCKKCVFICDCVDNEKKKSGKLSSPFTTVQHQIQEISFFLSFELTSSVMQPSVILTGTVQDL